MAVDRPEFRLSDAERQEALDALSEHVRTGRLDLVEFEERSGRVGASKFRRDLEPLFSDLPEPRPSVLGSAKRVTPVTPPSPTATAPQPPWQQRLASAAVPVATVVAIVLFFTVAKGVIFIFFLPAIVAALMGSFGSGRDRRGRRRRF